MPLVMTDALSLITYSGRCPIFSMQDKCLDFNNLLFLLDDTAMSNMDTSCAGRGVSLCCAGTQVSVITSHCLSSYSHRRSLHIYLIHGSFSGNYIYKPHFFTRFSIVFRLGIRPRMPSNASFIIFEISTTARKPQFMRL